MFNDVRDAIRALRGTPMVTAVLLVNTPAGWRVDDIAYGGGWAFGNKGRLSELLKQTIALQ